MNTNTRLVAERGKKYIATERGNVIAEIDVPYGDAKIVNIQEHDKQDLKFMRRKLFFQATSIGMLVGLAVYFSKR